MYITKWIEGEKNLNDFCLKRFHEEPRFIGGIGKFLGTPAKVYKKEKYREDKQRYVQMFLLFMQDAEGKVSDINNIQHQSYEDIRINKGSILVP